MFLMQNVRLPFWNCTFFSEFYSPLCNIIADLQYFRSKRGEMPILWETFRNCYQILQRIMRQTSLECWDFGHIPLYPQGSLESYLYVACYCLVMDRVYIFGGKNCRFSIDYVFCRKSTYWISKCHGKMSFY